MGHTPTASPAKVIRIAKAEVGYHEGRSNGHWNNHEKFAPEVPGLEWAQNQAWCATFVSWCAMKAGLASLYPRTASTDLGARWFKNAKRWSEYPAIGAQVFFGINGDMYHTGIVYDYDGTYVYTIEGNTNSSGSSEGDGVYLKKRLRSSSTLQGYGYPKFAEGIVSADPAYAKKAPKPAAKPAAAKVAPAPKVAHADKMNPKSYRMNVRNDAVVWLKSRLIAKGFGKSIGQPKTPLYGAGVKAAVAAFQRHQGWHGAEADGFPGKETLKRLAK